MNINKDITVYYDNEAFDILNKYACSCYDDTEVYVNIKKHKSTAGLLDTIVHELVHIKYPNLKHGPKFQDMINNIIISS